MDVVTTMLGVLLEVPVAVVATVLAARMLGVRRSWAAIACAGLVGWVCGNLLEVALHDWHWSRASLSVPTVAYAIVFTMLAAVTFDFTAQPGSLARGERAGLFVMPRPLRDLHRRLGPYVRYREIIRIARANGLGLGRRPATPAALGAALRRTLEASGVVFVKLGQMASTREDLLPRPLTTELAKLQSQVEPAPPDAMRAALEDELGGSVDEVFGEFEWTPLGSASIAQTYAARLRTGEAVVVKVQRPGIEDDVRRDTAALLHLARLVERRTPEGNQFRVGALAEEFARSLRQELDFPREAANALDLSNAGSGSAPVRIPRIYSELSSGRVLVQERFTGVSVSRRRIAELGLDEAVIADRLIEAMVDQLLYGHFHADLHPGNVLLLDDGSLGLIDFGSTGRLHPSQRAALAQLFLAAMRRDAGALTDSVEQVTTVGVDVSRDALERALATYLGEHIAGDISMDAINDLVPLLAEFDIRLPSELTLLFRALVLLEGTVRTIAPGYAVLDGMTRALDARMPAATKLYKPDNPMLEQLFDELPRLERLPAQLDRIATMTARGELRARIALFSTERDARVIVTLVNRMVLGIVGGMIAIGSALLLLVEDGGGSDGTSLTRVFGFLGLALATALLLRVVAAVVRDGYN